MADLETFNTKNKYTDYAFKVGKPLTQEVDADRANVIVPVVLDLKHDFESASPQNPPQPTRDAAEPRFAVSEKPLN
jgi:hypothetical protein